MKQLIGLICCVLLVFGLVGWVGYDIWQTEVVPRQEFARYFNMSRPRDSAAKEAAIPKAVSRLFELHGQLPEKEFKDLNDQISEAESRVGESQEARDRYFRLLGQRDQLFKQSRPQYSQFAAACTSAEVTLGITDIYTPPGKFFVEAGCPTYSDFF
ncbi:MAG TPA: hypothetical protein VMT81_00815 [Candidatus Paceibacterota bacterium]|nr:hypothetical protein [Candidatus Paceibacterota bacterium]